MKTTLLAIALGALSIFAFVPSCKKQIKLADTVVSIKEISEIGQLITAEYHGEVISSLSLIQAAYLEDKVLKPTFEIIQQTKQRIDTIVTTRFDKRLSELNLELAELKVELANLKKDPKKNSKKIARSQNDSLKFELRIDRLNRKIERKKFRSFNNNLTREEKRAMKVLQKSTGKNKKKVLAKIANTNFDEFSQKNKNEINKKREKEFKEDIAYLGRGAVKAGYDLQALDSINVFVSPSRDTIYFIDFDPQLFDVDINPWYYFDENKDMATEDERRLFGFELFDVNIKKRTQITLDQINKVKSDCKRKLRQEALDREIYNAAKINAENTLLSFFQLLSLEPGQDVTRVVISHSKYFDDKVDFLYDLTIDEEELLEIQSIVNEDTLLKDDLAFPYQSMDYQLRYLDKFMLELYDKTMGSENDPDWANTYTAYFNQRNIYLTN